MSKRGKIVVVFEVSEFTRLEGEFMSPIAPLSVAIKFWNINRRKAYRWIERGKLKACRVWGQLFVPVSQTVSLRNKQIKLG